MNRSIRDLIVSYHELNGNAVDELSQAPSPLEFMRYAAINRPFVLRGGISKWPAVQEWNVAYLKAAMGEKMVNVAITPEGFLKCVLWRRRAKSNAR
jgi:jumonji domain-containing protein 7